MVEASDAELARHILFQTLGEDPAELPIYIGEGSVNIVFSAEISGATLAVRIAKELGDLGEFENERCNIQRAARAGVPVANVLQVGQMAGRPYMIQSFVLGRTGDKSDIPQSELWRQLGEYAHLIHTVNAEPSGAELTDQERKQYTVDAPAEWIKFVQYNIEQLTPNDPMLGLGVYESSERGALIQIFRELQQSQFEFGLIHNDLDPRHLIVSNSGSKTLIDWGESIAHIVPHVDLAEILRWHQPQDDAVVSFLHGYGMSSQTFQRLLPEVRSYQLLKSFDLVRWAKEHRPWQIDAYARRAAADVGGVLRGTTVRTEQGRVLEESYVV